MGFSLRVKGRPARVQRQHSRAFGNQENEAAEHCKIGAGVAHRKPETLGGAKQFRNFRRGDRGADDNQERESGNAREKSGQNKQAAGDFEKSNEERREVRMRKPNSGKTLNAHVRVGEFEDSLGEKNQSYGNTDQQDGARAGFWSKKELRERLHVRCSPFR